MGRTLRMEWAQCTTFRLPLNTVAETAFTVAGMYRSKFKNSFHTGHVPNYDNVLMYKKAWYYVSSVTSLYFLYFCL